MFSYNLFNSFWNNTAVITSDEKEFSYGDLNRISERIYESIGNRCLIFILCDNRYESLCGYISCLTNKVVPLLLNLSINTISLFKLIETYKPQYLWLPKVRVSEFSNQKVVFELEEYVLTKLNNEKVELNENLALLLTTSGSTGSPKLVRISYSNLASNTTSIIKYLSVKISDRPITTMPMNYSFGLSILNTHLFSGSTILLTSESLVNKKFWEFIRRHKATTLSGVPYIYEILKRLKFCEMDLPHLKTLTQAGGKLALRINKEFAEYCSRKGISFFVMYGQTEATARMSYLPPKYTISKLGSIGKPIPGGEFILINENNTIIDGTGTAGELIYKGPNVSMGYAESIQDLSKDDENKGVLYTGDLAIKDSENFYYIVGRKSRFIKLFGHRINLDEIESIVKNNFTDCACTGTDDNLIIYLTLINEEKEIKDYLVKKVGLHPHGVTIKIINEIPKNNNGKIDYESLPKN